MIGVLWYGLSVKICSKNPTNQLIKRQMTWHIRGFGALFGALHRCFQPFCAGVGPVEDLCGSLGNGVLYRKVADLSLEFLLDVGFP